MSDVEASACRVDEESKLRDFLRTHWKSDHVFVKHPDVLLWQHRREHPEQINFIVARDCVTGEFVGVLGFIPPAQFDAALEGEGDYWWAIFKVRNDQTGKGIGKKIIEAFEATQEPVSIGGIGLSEMVIPIYRKLGFEVGRVNHYYRVNRDRSHFALVRRFDGRYSADGADDTTRSRLHRLDAGSLERFAQSVAAGVTPQRPHKSPRYLVRRYAEHPWYVYLTLGLTTGEKERGVLIARACPHGEAVALRIVDYWGEHEALGDVGPELETLMREHHAEYVDVYNLGINPDVFARAGLLHRADDGTVVIPNYFEPYAARNVNLDFMCRNQDASEPYVMFKGDADQDRPSIF